MSGKVSCIRVPALCVPSLNFDVYHRLSDHVDVQDPFMNLYALISNLYQMGWGEGDISVVSIGIEAKMRIQCY